MRRAELYQAVSRILKDLIEAGVDTFLNEQRHNLLAEHKNNSSKSIFDTFQKYSVATHNYSDLENDICNMLGINELQSPKFWQASIEETESSILLISSNVNFAIQKLPMLLSLLKQGHIQEVKSQESDIPEALKGMSILTVLIVEEGEQFSTPKRLTSALNAIIELYSVVATIENQHENELIVLACDSGSDKSFDFAAPAKLMEQVKEIIISIWDRKVFHRHANTQQDLNLISNSLPIFEKIHNLKEQGVLSPEESEILKQKIISGVTHFEDSGSIIPEFEAESRHSPRQLMKPKQKLLASYAEKPQPKKKNKKKKK
jgi:hypothetical protein